MHGHSYTLCMYDIMLLNGENHTWTARATSGGFSLLHSIWYYIIIIFRARPPSSSPLFNPVPGNDRKIFINSGDSGYCGVVHESTTFRWLFLNHNIIAIRSVKTNGSWRRVQRCAWIYTVSTEKSESNIYPSVIRVWIIINCWRCIVLKKKMLLPSYV